MIENNNFECIEKFYMLWDPLREAKGSLKSLEDYGNILANTINNNDLRVSKGKITDIFPKKSSLNEHQSSHLISPLLKRHNHFHTIIINSHPLPKENSSAERKNADQEEEEKKKNDSSALLIAGALAVMALCFAGIVNIYNTFNEQAVNLSVGIANSFAENRFYFMNHLNQNTWALESARQGLPFVSAVNLPFYGFLYNIKAQLDLIYKNKDKNISPFTTIFFDFLINAGSLAICSGLSFSLKVLLGITATKLMMSLFIGVAVCSFICGSLRVYENKILLKRAKMEISSLEKKREEIRKKRGEDQREAEEPIHMDQTVIASKKRKQDSDNKILQGHIQEGNLQNMVISYSDVALGGARNSFLAVYYTCLYGIMATGISLCQLPLLVLSLSHSNSVEEEQRLRR